MSTTKKYEKVADVTVDTPHVEPVPDTYGGWHWPEVNVIMENVHLWPPDEIPKNFIRKKIARSAKKSFIFGKVVYQR